MRRTEAEPFKGNKRTLPSTPCVGCARPMTWRKSWARNWDDVKFCSEACRRARGPANPAERLR